VNLFWIIQKWFEITKLRIIFQTRNIWNHIHMKSESKIIYLNLLIYLWRKEGSLFCLYRWDALNWDASDHVLGLFGKLSRRRGASAQFHGDWTCDAKVLEYWMISSLKIKLNHSQNFWRNWNVPLVLLERSLGFELGEIWEKQHHHEKEYFSQKLFQRYWRFGTSTWWLRYAKNCLPFNTQSNWNLR